MQPTRYGQQTPSGDIRNFSQDLNSKAHNDKPFFATAVRLFLLDRSSPSRLVSIESLSGIMNLFFHGGQPLQVLNEKDYQAILGEPSIRELIERGLTYRPGFLLNSWELTGLVHFPSISRSDPRVLALSWNEPIRPLRSDLDRGTRIGRCRISGQERVIHIPSSIRACHTHIIGRPYMGKSNTMENMILADIDQNQGVAVIDPHGDLIEEILHRIPPGKVERVIYFEPGNREWAMIWNPLTLNEEQEAGRVADNLVGVIKSIVSGWGDRLENILRYCFLAFL